MKLAKGEAGLVTGKDKEELKAKLREEVKDGNGMNWGMFSRERVYNMTNPICPVQIGWVYSVQIVPYKGPNWAGITQNVETVDYLVKSLGYEDKQGKFLRED